MGHRSHPIPRRPPGGKLLGVGGRAAYPGSFDPLTIAHLAIAETAWSTHSLDRVDLVISQVALGFIRNKEIRETQEFANLVRDVVLDEKTFREEFRSEFLGYLDDIKYESAKQVLPEILEKSTSERVKSAAKRTLAANFPAPPPAAVVKDPKKKK